jgi:hypothetical protein
MAPLTHPKLGASLVLMDVEAMRQRDLDKYMAAMREPKLGDSTPETDHKIVFAGLRSGVVKEARVSDRPEPLTAADVADLAPARVRWFARKINALYSQAVAIPPE